LILDKNIFKLFFEYIRKIRSNINTRFILVFVPRS